VNFAKNPIYQNAKGCLILGLASLIWGFAFAVQSHAADLIPPFLFNGSRSLIAAAFLWGFLGLRKAIFKKRILPQSSADRKKLFVVGLICGILLTVTVNFQQFGLAVYPEGVAAEARAGFLTALYVILVPLFAMFVGRKPSPTVWLGVAVAAVGIYLLCFAGGIGQVYWGDALVLLCAFGFTFHILVIDRYGSALDGIALSMIQFLVCGVLSALISLPTEEMIWSNLPTVMPNLLYMGILSSGVAYTLQIVGQKYAEPAVASIVMSLESVFAALGGWILLNNTLSSRELIGCALVFVAILLAQLPPISFRKKRV